MLNVLEASNNRPTLISLNNINKQTPPPCRGIKRPNNNGRMFVLAHVKVV